MSRRDTYLARRAAARLKKRLIGAACVVAVVGVIVLGLLVEPERAVAAHPEWVQTASYVQAAPSAPTPSLASAATPRRIYPYSIIPGGVADREELARVILIDNVVAEHYGSFRVDKAVKLTVTKPRAVYVSYRKGDKVYWTSRKLMLVKGELLLSDGENEMRARCANRISDTPQLPVEMNEPSAEELDAVMAISMDPDDLGMDDAEGVGGGAAFGQGAGQAGKELLAANNADGAGARMGGGRAGPGAGLEAGRFNGFGPAPGNSSSGSSPGTPVAPEQGNNEEQGGTALTPPVPGSTPITPSPELAPGNPAMPGPGGPPSTPQGSNPRPAETPGSGPPPGVTPPPGIPQTPKPAPDVPEPPALPPTELPPAELPQAPGEIEHEVPEPDTLALFGLAFAGMLLLRRKKPARLARRITD